MAAAEIRAVWQRTANRCFVQEDAKRAPKLACATSKLVDPGQASAADESDHAAVNVTSFNRKSSFPNFAPDPRWWLMQPNYGLQKGVTYEQLNALEDEVEIVKDGDENKAHEGEDTQFGDGNHDSFDYIQHDFQTGIMKKMKKDRMQEAYGENSQAFPEIIDMMAKHETIEIDSVGCSVSKQTYDLSFDSDYSWIEGEKAQPWWRTADRDKLSSFVSQKSVNHVENCDLPPPQKKYLRRQPCADVSDDKIKTTSFDLEAKSSGFSNLTVQEMGTLDLGLMHKKHGPSANKGHLYFGSGISSSDTTIPEDVIEQVFDGDPSKVQLMEALCHSQTRAREAEEVARQAYAEKEYIVALLIKQASQLFAYKQCFRLLQLENLHIHIKNKDQPDNTLFPLHLPNMPFAIRKPRKRKHKFANAKQEKQAKPKNDVSTTYAVAFALGMSLVGAGLFLGWTVGWMLPRL
ncbi:hypothetical protein TanjilG_11194 [Lupinus angustifolius]|uniref:Uncharacterized protein n=1 Tax=Lupinus angustifolius TaxID=3871 RepID=A0A1J7GPF2_LUPAN|nr:PREDICTED: uncharacterized protein LOC109360263 isoform X1 [Lupinus angustifolius]XP_019460558.1 PREDICTED: uncharacterized protein LOC109360263 isoform X1 [Lupinus angustifolius]OIW02300.1 hypothetical protein TanjilG_11194 [Lupinus angustifolius]